MMQRQRVLISGGGTAGHIHPALAVGRKLKEKNRDIQITFVGSTRKLERSIMDHYHADFIPLKIEGLKGRGIKIARSLFILPAAFLRSMSILIKLKPSLSIGVGGYSSGPIVLISAWLGIPTLILEQNSLPGFTNRMLIPWVKKAVVSFESSLPYFKKKGICLGNPVRDEFYALPPKQRTDRLTLLIFGGSQGSRFLNEGMIKSLPLLTQEAENLIIYHQTGENNLEQVKQAYLKHGIRNVMVKAFFHNMADYFQKSDLVICRAGATTIAELIAGKKASLLIPFAGAADNHQLHNAKELEKIQGTEILTEQEFTPELFARKIIRFVKNKTRLDQMEKNLALLKKTGAAEKIADLCFELIKKKARSN